MEYMGYRDCEVLWGCIVGGVNGVCVGYMECCVVYGGCDGIFGYI